MCFADLAAAARVHSTPLCGYRCTEEGMNLNAWTKIGDILPVTGRWRLYQHKARILSDVEEIGSWTPEEVDVATRAYQARAEKVHRGGLWLVAPDGKVAARMWVPVVIRNFGG